MSQQIWIGLFAIFFLIKRFVSRVFRCGARCSPPSIIAVVLLAVVALGCDGHTNSPTLKMQGKSPSNDEAGQLEQSMTTSDPAEVSEIQFEAVASFNGMEQGELVGEIKSLLSDSGIECICAGSRALYVSVSQDDVKEAKTHLRRFQTEHKKKFFIFENINHREPDND